MVTPTVVKVGLVNSGFTQNKAEVKVGLVNKDQRLLITTLNQTTCNLQNKTNSLLPKL